VVKVTGSSAKMIGKKFSVGIQNYPYSAKEWNVFIEETMNIY
jgi:hypothetical protein